MSICLCDTFLVPLFFKNATFRLWNVPDRDIIDSSPKGRHMPYAYNHTTNIAFYNVGVRFT
jgi:hypothetical protein